jgi:hypothetical protein
MIVSMSGYGRVRVTNGNGNGSTVEFPAPTDLGTISGIAEPGDIVVIHADGSGEIIRDPLEEES